MEAREEVGISQVKVVKVGRAVPLGVSRCPRQEETCVVLTVLNR